MGVKEVAERFKVSPAHVRQHLKLLGFEQRIIVAIHEGRMGLSTAMALFKVSQEDVDHLAGAVVDGGGGPGAEALLRREARDLRRSRGEKIARTAAEVKGIIEDWSSDPEAGFGAQRFLGILAGDPDVSVEELRIALSGWPEDSHDSVEYEVARRWSG
jgi:hypothetical protein